MSSKRRGRIIILVAPSGAGKSTLAQRLLNDYPQIRFSTSATTRAPREGETDGRDYYFLGEDEFERKVRDNDFLEWEYYSGNRYGTLQPEVDKLMESGYFPLLDIEVKGALNVQEMYGPEAVSVFIKPPSMDVLEQRLRSRGSETDRSLQKRLERAREEMKFADCFDHTVVNDDLDTAYAELQAIIEPLIT